MLVIERMVDLLTDHPVVETDADIQQRDYWLVYLGGKSAGNFY
jgi:hypothetical protein